MMKRLCYILLSVILICILYISSDEARQVKETYGYGSALYLLNPHTALTNENAAVWAATRDVVDADLRSVMGDSVEFEVTAWEQGCKVLVVAEGEEEVSALIRSLSEEFIRARYMAELTQAMDTNSVQILDQSMGGGRWDSLTPSGRKTTWGAVLSTIVLFGVIRGLFKRVEGTPQNNGVQATK